MIPYPRDAPIGLRILDVLMAPALLLVRVRDRVRLRVRVRVRVRGWG